MALPQRQFGQYTGYTRRPDGGFNFQLADGRTMPSPPSETAAEVARKIDALRPSVGAAPSAGPDQRLAFNAVQPDDATRQVSDAVFGGAEGQRASEQAAAPTERYVYDRQGKYVDTATGDIGEMRRASKGGLVPSALQQTTQGGYEQSPEYIESQKESLKEQTRAIDDLTHARVEKAEAERQMFTQGVAATGQQMAEQSQMLEELRTKTAESERYAQEQEQDAAAAKEDPSRLFRGTGGTFKAIGAAISVGLGAFGAALARTPNYALSMIDRAIDRDIDAQRSEIAQKKDSAKGALAQHIRNGLSLERAEALLRSQQLQYATLTAQANAAKFSGQEQEALARQLTSELQQKHAQSMEEYRIRSGGEITQSVSARYQAPSAGGFVPDSAKEVLEREGKARTNEKLRLDAASGGDQRPTSPELSNRIAKNASLFNAATEVDRELNETGEWRGEILDPTGISAGAYNPIGLGIINKGSRNKIEQASSQFAAEYQSAAGIGSSDADAARVREFTMGNGSYAARKRGAKAGQEHAVQTVASEIGILPPAQRNKVIETLPESMRDEVILRLQRGK
jgi:hypothetical protein